MGWRFLALSYSEFPHRNPPPCLMNVLFNWSTLIIQTNRVDIGAGRRFLDLATVLVYALRRFLLPVKFAPSCFGRLADCPSTGGTYFPIRHLDRLFCFGLRHSSQQPSTFLCQSYPASCRSTHRSTLWYVLSSTIY